MLFLELDKEGGCKQTTEAMYVEQGEEFLD